MAPGMSKMAVVNANTRRASTSFAATRTLALRILFGGVGAAGRDSAAQIRHGLQVLLREFRSKGLPALLLLFHPKNTHGVLLTMTLVAFLVNRYSGVHARAEAAYKRRYWRGVMRSAPTYEEWAYAAQMLEKEEESTRDGEEGRAPFSRLYDEELVRSKLQELQLRRQQGSVRDIMFCMRADLLRNMGNMCNPQLHKGSIQVPGPIRDYIDEVAEQLRLVVESDEDTGNFGGSAATEQQLTLEEKLAFVHETRHAFGRTALLLSGGATLGAFHVGILRTLAEHGLLPRIICGSSGGSIVSAIASTRTDSELLDFFDNSLGGLKFFDKLGGILAIMRRVVTQGAVHEIKQLQLMVRDVTGNMTFQEAYDLSGRILCVTVCSPRQQEPPRCLNYLTSPHVLIWSAVTASCAFPGLFQAQELMAKDRYGNIVPYHALYSQQGSLKGGATIVVSAPASVRRWRDGSLESDLPIEQLKELFNVNHFIVSQANPHIAPILRLKEFVRGYMGNFAAKMAQLAEMEVKHRCNQILELGIPVGAALAKLFAQEWEGDITIVMPATLAQYWRIIQNPTAMDFQKAISQARRCTWEKLAAIKANCGIEMALDECVALLNRMRRARRHAQRAASFRGSLHIPRPLSGSAAANNHTSFRRIPSWNCIAMDGFASDDDASSLPATPNSRVPTPYPYTPRQAGTGGTPTSNNNNYCSNTYGWQDAVPETPSNLVAGSWTPMGGPLTRAAVSPMATKPISIPTPTKGNDNNHRSDTDQMLHDLRVPPSPNSIVVAEGDLLHTTRTGNGFVFNVVRKDDYSANNGYGSWGVFGCPDESVPHDQHGAEEVAADYDHGDDGCNSSSSSDCGDDGCAEPNCDLQTVNNHLHPDTSCQVVAKA